VQRRNFPARRVEGSLALLFYIEERVLDRLLPERGRRIGLIPERKGNSAGKKGEGEWHISGENGP